MNGALVHLLCRFLLPFFFPFLALSSSPCPSSCANIPNVSFPFGAAPGCGAPGFMLTNCDSSLAHWVFDDNNPTVFGVRDIRNHHSSGSLSLTWATDELHSESHYDKCCILRRPNLSAPCYLLDGVNLSSFTQANLTLSSTNVYLLFHCQREVFRHARTFVEDSKYCKCFENNCSETQIPTDTDQSIRCIQFGPNMQELDFDDILNCCFGYILFVATDFTREQSVTAWDASSIELDWSKPWYDSECDTCERSSGTCRYDPNNLTFSCFNDDDQLCKTHCPGRDYSGFFRHTLSKALAIGLPLAVVLVSVAVFVACVVCRRKKLFLSKTRSSSGASLVTGLRESSAVEFGYVAIRQFIFKELDHATESFSDDRLLGDGGFGAVYEGRLSDGRKVAVKRLYRAFSRRMEQFFKEVTILSLLAHENLVKFYGYCCEDQSNLILVFEYLSNGTLTDHLQNPIAEALPWKIRLKIACEIAQALSYLHNTITPSIFHGDVKSQNILLDQDFHAKLADFGLSRLVPPHASHISTTPQGTPGYLDPDYRHCYQLTDKSDVYSFGVVLVELVSALPAVDMSRNQGEINLSSLALSRISCGAWQELLDSRLEIHQEPRTEDMARRVMELAFRCLAEEKENRPGTKEVVRELGNIWQYGYGELNSRVSFAKNGSSSRLIQHEGEFSPTSNHLPWSSSSAFYSHSIGFSPNCQSFT